MSEIVVAMFLLGFGLGGLNARKGTGLQAADRQGHMGRIWDRRKPWPGDHTAQGRIASARWEYSREWARGQMSMGVCRAIALRYGGNVEEEE